METVIDKLNYEIMCKHTDDPVKNAMLHYLVNEFVGPYLMSRATQRRKDKVIAWYRWQESKTPYGIWTDMFDNFGMMNGYWYEETFKRPAYDFFKEFDKHFPENKMALDREMKNHIYKWRTDRSHKNTVFDTMHELESCAIDDCENKNIQKWFYGERFVAYPGARYMDEGASGNDR